LYQHDPEDPNSLSDNSVYQILEDRDGTLWLGTYGGLNHFDPQTGVFTRYVSSPADPNTLSANSVRVLLHGGDGDLWIGTQDGGLNRLDRSSGQITRYPSDPADPQRLSGNGITGLARDESGMIWVATDDAGLNRLDPQTGAVTRFGRAQGLVDPRVMALAYVPQEDETDASALWLSTGSGLARFDVQTETFRNYDSSDGLPASDFVPYAVYQGVQGELFFGGLDSVVAFEPASIKEARLQPKAQFAELYINNRPQPISADGILPTAIFATEVITMPAGAQAVTLLFSAPGYPDARNVRFRFRLQGFDQDWVEAQPMQRAATYTALDPGRYVFELQAAGRTGGWNETGRQLALMLEPAWWQVWWVRPLAAVLAVALLAAAIVSGFQTRLRITKRRNELLEREVAARTTELSALLSVSQSITSERNLDPLLVRVLDNVRHAIPHTGGILLLRNGAADAVEAYSVMGEATTIAKSSMPLSTFRAVAVAIGPGRLFKLPDLNGSGADVQMLTGLLEDAAFTGSWLAAPLVEQGEVIGSLLLYDIKPDPFDYDDLPKLQRFANQLAIALENVRLQAQAQRLAVDLERSRLSRELHDSVTQLLHSISLHANAAERALALGRPAHGAENMRQAQHLAQEAIHELRTLIFELRLTPLEEGGLQVALKAYLDTVVARSGLAVHLDACTERRWAQDVEFELYRIAQEALTNVVKHAAASRVVVVLRENQSCSDSRCVTLEIVDNGTGFDLAAARQRGTVGLQSMAERAQKIGAALTVQSQAGRGTTVRVELNGETDGGSKPG
jgi:signal transduction histidine kinase